MAESKEYVVGTSMIKSHRGLEKMCNEMHAQGYHLVTTQVHRHDWMYLFFKKND